MKKLILLLITILLCSCGPSRYTRLVQENARLSSEVSNLKEETQANRYTGSQKASGSYYTQGDLVRNIRGVIIAKSIIRSKEMSWFFYIQLENNKQIRWETTQSKYEQKKKGSPVYFEYIGKHRFRNKLL